MSRRRRILGWGLLVVLLLAGGLVGLGWRYSGPRWEGPVSEHFDGRRFQNAEPTGHTDARTVLRWMATRDKGDFPAELPVPAEAVPERVEGDTLRVTMVGHSTVLVQVAGLNLLTDPIWSERASPVQFAGPARFTAPGLTLGELPPIDAVVLSHNHYDHLDRDSLRELDALHAPVFFVPLGLRAQLRAWGIEGEVRELDWWAAAELDGRRLHCVPVRHFSGRGTFDRNATLWCGWVIEDPGGSIYFGGDSGFGAHLAKTAERLGAPRLALLPIGAYLPRWFMSPVHMDPAEAVRAHEVLGAATSVAIHAGCFQLADDGRQQAYDDLEAALIERGVSPEVFLTPRAGEALEVPGLRRLESSRR